MKKTFLLLVLFSILLDAQSHRFTYEYTLVKDSLHHENQTKELMNLDITPQGSYFYSATRLKFDSISEARMALNNSDLTGVQFSEVPDVVIKKYPITETDHYKRVGHQSAYYKLTGKEKINWKILPEKKQIENIPVQRADATAYGRKWVAWFAPKFPFSDGPYTFSGLPGLILSIEDTTKSHSFLLKGIQKIATAYDIPPTVKTALANPITVTFAQYKKVFQINRQDPNVELKQHIASGGKVSLVDDKGKSLDVNEFLKDQDRQNNERNARDNNYLDLNLLK